MRPGKRLILVLTIITAAVAAAVCVVIILQFGGKTPATAEEFIAAKDGNIIKALGY